MVQTAPGNRSSISNRKRRHLGEISLNMKLRFPVVISTAQAITRYNPIILLHIEVELNQKALFKGRAGNACHLYTRYYQLEYVTIDICTERIVNHSN